MYSERLPQELKKHYEIGDWRARLRTATTARGRSICIEKLRALGVPQDEIDTMPAMPALPTVIVEEEK